MSLGDRLKKAINKCKNTITKPFIHDGKKEIEKQHQMAINGCYQSEQNALNKLNIEREAELQKIALENKKLEELIKTHHAQYLLEKERLNQYLQQKEKAFEDAFIQITNNYKALRNALQACVTGNNEIIEIVLKRDSELKGTFFSLNPLYFAAGNNQTSTIELLCKNGANVNQRYTDGNTPLDVAGVGACVEASNLIKKIMAETTLFWNAYELNDTNAMKASLEKGASINTSDSNGLTVLQKAVLDKKPYEFIRLLVELGANGFNSWFQLDDHIIPKSSDNSSNEQKTNAETKSNCEIKEVVEEKTNCERKEILEKNTSTQEKTKVNVENKILEEIEKHPDWRVIDYVKHLHKINQSSRLTTFNFCVELPPIPDAIMCFTGRLPLCAERLSSIVNVQERKFLFSIGHRANIKLDKYDIQKNEWSRIHLGIDEPITLRENQSGELEKINKEVAEWQSKIFPRPFSTSIQNYKNKENKELLMLLSSSSCKIHEVVFVQFDPEFNTWKIGSKGPQLDTLSKMEAIFKINEPTENGQEVFLLAIDGVHKWKERKIIFWTYNINLDIWQELTCPINSIDYIMEAKIIKYENQSKLYVLIDRYSDSVKRIFELWSYGLLEKNWINEGEYNTNENYKLSGAFAPIQMHTIQIEGEIHLLFMHRDHETMNVRSFNLKTKIWQEHFSLKFPPSFLAERLQIKLLPGHGLNSDIILLVSHSLKGIECTAYHPLFKKWISLNIPELLSPNYNVRNYQKVDILVEKIENQYKLNIFSSTHYVSKPITECFSYPINIFVLEERLKTGDEFIPQLYSENELTALVNYSTQLTTATNNLLLSAKRGDWPSVFSSLRQGADVYATDSEGYNALQLALHNQLDPITIKSLIHAGIDVNFRNSLKNKTTLEIARNLNSPLIHDYLANLLDKPVIYSMQEINVQFQNKYFDHLNRAQRFLNSCNNITDKLKAILSFYRVISKVNPYATYIWPSMLIIGELLNLPENILDEKKPYINNMLDFFVKTYALQKAITSVGIEHLELIKSNPVFDNNSIHVLNSIHLKNEAEILVKNLLDREYNTSIFDPEIIQATLNKERETLKSIILNVLMELSKALCIDTNWVEGAGIWLMKDLINSPTELMQHFKERFQQHLDKTAEYAKAASDDDLTLLPNKPDIRPELKKLTEQEKIAKEKLKIEHEKFLKEKEELEQWMLLREKECMDCIDDIRKCIEANNKMTKEIEEQFNKTIADVNAQFNHFRNTLNDDKNAAIRKMNKKAFTSLVVMAVGCCIAHFAGPLLASAIGGATTAGLSTHALTALSTVLKGGIMGSVNAIGNHQNILEGTIKGAAFATFGTAIDKMVGIVVNPNLSEMHKMIHITMSTGFESALRTSVERGKFKENVISTIGTGLLLSKLPFSSDQSMRLSFMEDLQLNIYKAFIGGGIYAAVAKKSFGSSMAQAAITATFSACAERLGSNMALTVSNQFMKPQEIAQNEYKKVKENAEIYSRNTTKNDSSGNSNTKESAKTKNQSNIEQDVHSGYAKAPEELLEKAADNRFEKYTKAPDQESTPKQPSSFHKNINRGKNHFFHSKPMVTNNQQDSIKQAANWLNMAWRSFKGEETADVQTWQKENRDKAPNLATFSEKQRSTNNAFVQGVKNSVVGPVTFVAEEAARISLGEQTKTGKVLVETGTFLGEEAARFSLNEKTKMEQFMYEANRFIRMESTRVQLGVPTKTGDVIANGLNNLSQMSAEQLSEHCGSFIGGTLFFAGLGTTFNVSGSLLKTTAKTGYDLSTKTSNAIEKGLIILGKKTGNVIKATTDDLLNMMTPAYESQLAYAGVRTGNKNPVKLIHKKHINEMNRNLHEPKQNLRSSLETGTASAKRELKPKENLNSKTSNYRHKPMNTIELKNSMENDIFHKTIKDAYIGNGLTRANSASDALRLKAELAFKEAGFLDINGNLTIKAISSRRILKEGDKLNNPNLISELTRDGTSIKDWGKYSTTSIKNNNDQKIQIHFYFNRVTQKINQNWDYKVKEVIMPFKALNCEIPKI